MYNPVAAIVVAPPMRSECVAKSAPSSPRSAAQCGKHNCDTRLHGSSESSEPHKARIYAGCVAFGRKKPESATMAENRAFLLKKLRVRRLEPAAVGELRERLEQRLLVGCSTIISQKCERKKRNSFYWMQSINVDQSSWKIPPKKRNREIRFHPAFPLAFRDNLVCSSSTTPVASGGLR